MRTLLVFLAGMVTPFVVALLVTRGEPWLRARLKAQGIYLPDDEMA